MALLLIVVAIIVLLLTSVLMQGFSQAVSYYNGNQSLTEYSDPVTGLKFKLPQHWTIKSSSIPFELNYDQIICYYSTSPPTINVKSEEFIGQTKTLKDYATQRSNQMLRNPYLDISNINETMIANRPALRIDYSFVIPWYIRTSCENLFTKSGDWEGIGIKPIMRGVEYIFTNNNKGYHISFNDVFGEFKYRFPQVKRILDSVELVNSEGPIVSQKDQMHPDYSNRI